MAIRPPRAGFSVARAMSERARAARAEAERRPDDDADLAGFAGSMVDALRSLVERLTETAKAAGEQIDEARAEAGRTVTLGGSGAQMVFGYTLRMGPDGVAAERFGDVPQPRSRAEPAPRQPIIDVFEDGAAVVVVAELPGADADRITCTSDGKTLTIAADGARRYRKDVALPAPVLPEGFSRSFQNGILEVRLTRAGAP